MGDGIGHSQGKRIFVDDMRQTYLNIIEHLKEDIEYYTEVINKNTKKQKELYDQLESMIKKLEEDFPSKE